MTAANFGQEKRHMGSLFALLVTSLLPTSSNAADLDQAERLYRTGRYEDCAKLATAETAGGFHDERWDILLVRSERARGRATQAMAALEQGLRRFPFSVELHLLAHDVFRENGQDPRAGAELDAIERLLRSMPRQLTSSPESLVALGRYFLVRGADARRVLDQCYDVATKQWPDHLEGYFSTAELALAKEDAAVAAETLQKAPKAASQDPRYHYLLARAFATGEQAKAEKALAEALKINPRHVDSLLLQADHRIDAERYAEAEAVLRRALEVNPSEPRAWAYRAVLAHLRNDAAGEAKARAQALAPWAEDPEVDCIVGRKLAQKYRFAEGAAYQRKALTTNPDYLPAQIELCQALLRLGEEEEGWTLADSIFSKDAYNVVAYNLTTLRDRLKGFKTLEAAGLVVRMEAREAELYGDRVLDLLVRARKTLSEKYGAPLTQPVIVEIFPQRKEFAVRTFGLPGADGLLGVCFGRVVTANSPASQAGHPSNWEAVLWHEFCHVVTLTKTRNKMPRWLSEGISVFEEARANPAWAMPLNPKFRERLAGKGLVPFSRLSAAFLTAESSLDLQFAYFESAVAVEFLVERFGLDMLKGLLDDLGSGAAMEQTLPGRTKMTLDLLDGDFARFAREKAESGSPGTTWEEVDLSGDADSATLRAWLEKHAKSFRGWQRLAARLISEQKWADARDACKTLESLDPDYVGPENAPMMLAAIARRQKDEAAERAALEDLAARDGSALEAGLRLMELDEAAGDWTKLDRDARRLLAVNPLIPTPHRGLARAAEKLGHRDDAIAAYRALTRLDETDPADVHYHLARLLAEAGRRDEAKREVLKALDEAPRFLEAHRLLLDLVERREEARAR
jgi:tetratricopeptide (TPR) repeat protein